VDTFTYSKAFETAVEATENVAAVGRMFGIGTDRRQRFTLYDGFRLSIGPGEVIYITGQSGSGKSLLLRAIAAHLAVEGRCVDFSDVPLETGRPLVDSFGGGPDSLQRALYALSVAGLSDAYLFCRKPSELSEGQRYRFRLALALSTVSGGGAIVIDEFCSLLDRITARIIAANCRKFADRFAVTFVVATAHEDLAEDLAPDLHVEKLYGDRVLVRSAAGENTNDSKGSNDTNGNLTKRRLHSNHSHHLNHSCSSWEEPE
jgi:ABC-type ATPase with predicted acetyltransferase domain